MACTGDAEVVEVGEVAEPNGLTGTAELAATGGATEANGLEAAAAGVGAAVTAEPSGRRAARITRRPLIAEGRERDGAEQWAAEGGEAEMCLCFCVGSSAVLGRARSSRRLLWRLCDQHTLLEQCKEE